MKSFILKTQYKIDNALDAKLLGGPYLWGDRDAVGVEEKGSRSPELGGNVPFLAD